MTGTGYTEDCCWTDIRDYCKGKNCPCRCHVDVPSRVDALAAANARISELESRAERAEAALAFYADPAMYECDVKSVMHECADECWSGIDEDGGDRARAVLAGERGEAEA